MGQTTSSDPKTSLPQGRPDGDGSQPNGTKAQSEEGPGLEAPAGVTHRDLRRFYKVTLAEVFGQWEGEQRNPERSDCLRCLLAKRGAALITGRSVCTATLPVPEGQTTLCEADLEASGNGNPLQEPAPGSLYFYAETMALSTAVGATVDARINLANDPPAARVAGRRIDQQPPVRATAHACLAIPRPEKVSRVETRYRLRGEKLRGAKQRHAVLYAAPGFGKTTLQHRLAGRGVVFADTDDVPGATRAHVRQLLEWTSVLTNRLDLLDPEFPTVAFVPADAGVLGRRGAVKQLSGEDLDYWCDLHLFPNHRRIVKCLVDRSCLTEWICIDKWPAPLDTRIGAAFEAEFLQKIRDLGGTTQ